MIQRWYYAWLVSGGAVTLLLVLNHVILRDLGMLGFIIYAFAGMGFARKLGQLEQANIARTQKEEGP